jgi:hypothetical protein
MTKPLTAQFTIPLVDENRFREGEPLVFQRWLPLQEHDALTATEGEMRLRFWIDEECLRHLGRVEVDNLTNYVDLFVDKMHVDVSGIDVSNSLADMIVKMSTEGDFSPEHMRSTYDSVLIAEYRALGERIYLGVIKQFNRLMSYIRAFKGQYWLREQKPDVSNTHSEFLRLKARVKVGDSDWLRLRATGEYRFFWNAPTEERLVARGDWQGIRDHLAGERKAPLVGQLLAVADEFSESGHRRAALTEAVSALEIAISRFAQRANPESWSTLLAGRSDAAEFHNHVEHLGTTCTIGYLFPVIFSEEQLPSAILRTCQAAISARNTVIHGGQRDVDEEKLREYLRAIRDFCERLRRFGSDSG